MFAMGRSFFVLPCLNVPFVMYCLLVLGNVSSVSLERHKRQFHQKNYKQLELSKLTLPTAESVMLQNDMELVPTIDGNSDMYLIVPASVAASQEQSLQSLTELSDNKKYDNIERNSDMLMQENKYTPAAQFFWFTENGMETNIQDELIEKNELSEESDLANESFQPVPERIGNEIAKAGQEIQYKVETELNRKEANRNIDEFLNAVMDKAQTERQELHEQDVIGVVLEEQNKTPAAATETENLQKTEETAKEEPQINLQFKDFEKQEVKQANTFTKEQYDHSERNQSSEEPSVVTEEKENSEESEIGEEETSQVKEKTYENYSHINSMEEKDDVTWQTSGDGTKEAVDSRCTNENNLESEESVKSVEESHISVDAPHKNIIKLMDKHYLDEELKPAVVDISYVRDETSIKLGEFQTEEARKETDGTYALLGDKNSANGNITAEHIQSNYEIQDETKQTHYVVPAPSNETLEFDLLQSSGPEADSLLLNDAENAEERDNHEELMVEDQHVELNYLSLSIPNHEKQTQLISESFVEERPTSSEQPTQDKEFTTSKLNVHNNNEQAAMLQRTYEKQSNQNTSKKQPVKTVMKKPNAEVVLLIQDEYENSENIGPSEEIHLSEKSQSVEHAESDNNLKRYEEADPDRDIESNGKPENQQEDNTTESDHSTEHNTKKEKIQQLSVAGGEPVKNSLTLEETHSGDESVEIGMQYAHNYQEHSKRDEGQTFEQNQTSKNVEASDELNTEEVNKSIEESQTNADTAVYNHNDNVLYAEKNQSVVGVQSTDVEHSEKRKEIGTDNMKAGEIVISDVYSIKMEPLLEDTTHEEHADATFSSADMQKSETSAFSFEQDSGESGANPAEISTEEITPEESYSSEQEQENVGHLNVVPDESILKNIENPLEQLPAIELQNPLNEIYNSPNNDKNESNPEKDPTSILTTMEQMDTNDELTQQQRQQSLEEHHQDQQIAVEKTSSSTTSKPLNVLDSVLNYVNASFMHQMSNGNGGDKEQEIKKEQVFNSKLRRYDGAQVWRIVVQNDRERKLADELQTKYDGQLWKEVKREVDYLLKPQVLAGAEQHVRAANLSRIVLIDNLQKVIEVENPPAEEIKELQNRKGSRLTWQAYHRLGDIHSYFDYVSKTYSDICSIELIGHSIEKRPLKILKISNGNADNPGIWIDGGMHAREWISPAVVTFIANQIIEGWDDLPAYMHNINWYVHAVANPDGYEYSHTTDRLWRKNMRPHGRACPGVDLNRNFGYKWGGKGTSANPCSQTYRGSKAFSEPETFYISKYISNFPKETFKAYLSFHSYGQYILYPWGYDYHITKDMSDLDLVARQAGTIITKSTGAKFTVGSSATTLYPAAGGSDDWAKGIAGIKYSYTIEMGDTGRYGFILPADYIEPNGKNGFTVVETVAKSITMGKNARRRRLKAHKTH